MNRQDTRPPPPRSRILAAYAAVYVIWGSTYLAILFAIQTLPPFLMAGVRFAIAGALLYGWSRSRGAVAPARIHWRSAAIVGGFLLLGGNGGVVWAEQYVPSGIAALLVAILPLWMVLLEWIGPDRRRPTARVWLGVLLGFAGVAVLVVPGAANGRENVDMVGAIVLILASLSWAIGSLYSRRAPQPASQPLTSGMQMLAGGALLVLLGLGTGEAGTVAVERISLASAFAFVYLVTFGSLIGFSAYVWLLQVEPPSRVATYAYVNPVVAVALGWLLAGERLTAHSIVAAAIIVGAVALIVGAQRPEVACGDAAAGVPENDPAFQAGDDRPARSA